MRFRFVFACALPLLAGCGGGGSDAGPTVPMSTAPAAAQTPGGIWFAPAADGAVTMFIAETGQLVVQKLPIAFGSGAVVVTGTDRVTGAYDLVTPQTSPSAPRVSDQACLIEGTIIERASLQLSVTCEDTDGNVTEESFSMLYDPRYETPSSLDEIAGNYTLAFNPDTNSLSISNDGSIFGMFHNGGANCVVNGEVETIDPSFALYGFSFEFANCTGPFDQFEGATMSGLGLLALPTPTPGSFLLLLSGVVDGELEFFSVLYEPA